MKAQVDLLTTKNQERDTRELEKDIEMATMRENIERLDAAARAVDKDRLAMFLSNMLIKGIQKYMKMRGDKLFEGLNDLTHSTSRYTIYVNGIRDDEIAKIAWEQEIKLDGDYLTMLKGAGAYNGVRNKIAHETEYQFARLLLSHLYEGQKAHKHYSPMFKWVYDMTVDEEAKMPLPNEDIDDCPWFNALWERIQKSSSEG